MEDPPARLLFRGSLRRSGGGEAHSAWSVGLCCRCDVFLKPIAIWIRTRIQYLILQRCGVHLSPVPYSYFLPLPFLSPASFANDERNENDHLPHLHYTSSGVLNPSRLRSTTRQGTNPEGGEAGLVSDDKLSYTFPSHHRSTESYS
jgi:hypothetical protein